ncbi:MAG: tRNA-dependent cyclodipeptide synthase [bacterium]
MLPVIGMSPGNSYFKDKAVAFLLREAIKRYGKALVMVADVPATSTYLAMGYQLTKAQSKARLNGNNLKNRTQKVISDL